MARERLSGKPAVKRPLELEFNQERRFTVS